ncbi:MAG: AIPR family protein [Chloroflexi bacterium]|nr:AIPR family protein [Chloroflexota bacterium]
MRETNVVEALPKFLESFENLTAHFDEHFGELGSNQRGDTFLDLALKVISLTSEGQEFPPLRVSEKKSHDGGVDLYTSATENGRILCAQSKYKVRSKDEFDTIISKFKNFDSSLTPPTPEPSLFETSTAEVPRLAIPTFALATSSKLEGIITKYDASTLASCEFYRELLAQGRLFLVDGPRILMLLQQLYKKTHLIPSNVTLVSKSKWNKCESVYLGAVSGKDLVQLYNQHGDALFFENVRDFLGATSGKVVTTRSTVNEEIIKTISKEPAKMLARNNGITFRATEVEIGSDDRAADLSMAAIVNGCQTTMCLVHCAPVPDDCLVQVKIVRTTDAWDIAKAANYQNPVTRVDLDLARYLRPQLVRRLALTLGYAVETETSVSASSVLNTIYQTKIDYDELKVLVLGLFSRKPNNLFEGNYTELRGDILERLYDQHNGDEAVFSVLLLLLKESRVALGVCEQTYSGEEYAPLFKRFYMDDKPRYRVYFAIAALCALLRDDISERSSDTATELDRTNRFLATARRELENRADAYHDAFLLTFLAVADSVLDIPAGKPEAEIAQSMFNKISTTAFSSLYKKVLMRMDSDKQRRQARSTKSEGKAN